MLFIIVREKGKKLGKNIVKICNYSIKEWNIALALAVTVSRFDKTYVLSIKVLEMFIQKLLLTFGQWFF